MAEKCMKTLRQIVADRGQANDYSSWALDHLKKRGLITRGQVNGHPAWVATTKGLKQIADAEIKRHSRPTVWQS